MPLIRCDEQQPEAVARANAGGQERPVRGNGLRRGAPQPRGVALTGSDGGPALPYSSTARTWNSYSMPFSKRPTVSNPQPSLAHS